jgi:hypothetical protein
MREQKYIEICKIAIEAMHLAGICYKTVSRIYLVLGFVNAVRGFPRNYVDYFDKIMRMLSLWLDGIALTYAKRLFGIKSIVVRKFIHIITFF